MMESIAAASMEMSAAQFSTEYAIAVTKKAMDMQELAAQEIMQMLPPTQVSGPHGQYIDTYA